MSVLSQTFNGIAEFLYPETYAELDRSEQRLVAAQRRLAVAQAKIEGERLEHVTDEDVVESQKQLTASLESMGYKGDFQTSITEAQAHLYQLAGIEGNPEYTPEIGAQIKSRIIEMRDQKVTYGIREFDFTKLEAIESVIKDEGRGGFATKDALQSGVKKILGNQLGAKENLPGVRDFMKDPDSIIKNLNTYYAGLDPEQKVKMQANVAKVESSIPEADEGMSPVMRLLSGDMSPETMLAGIGQFIELIKEFAGYDLTPAFNRIAGTLGLPELGHTVGANAEADAEVAAEEKPDPEKEEELRKTAALDNEGSMNVSQPANDMPAPADPELTASLPAHGI